MAGIVVEVISGRMLPLSLLGLCPAFDPGSAACIEAVHEFNADLDFGCLAVRVS